MPAETVTASTRENRSPEAGYSDKFGRFGQLRPLVPDLQKWGSLGAEAPTPFLRHLLLFIAIDDAILVLRVLSLQNIITL